MAGEQIEIEATVAEETDDVVRTMTVHGAKCLEYPIVALANLARRNINHVRRVPWNTSSSCISASAPAAPGERPLQDPRLRRRLGTGENTRSKPSACAGSMSPAPVPART
jgi:ATP-dependent exoDNAse (exonuclease V) beta subunit